MEHIAQIGDSKANRGTVPVEMTGGAQVDPGTRLRRARPAEGAKGVRRYGQMATGQRLDQTAEGRGWQVPEPFQLVDAEHHCAGRRRQQQARDGRVGQGERLGRWSLAHALLPPATGGGKRLPPWAGAGGVDTQRVGDLPQRGGDLCGSGGAVGRHRHLERHGEGWQREPRLQPPHVVADRVGALLLEAEQAAHARCPPAARELPAAQGPQHKLERGRHIAWRTYGPQQRGEQIAIGLGVGAQREIGGAGLAIALPAPHGASAWRCGGHIRDDFDQHVGDMRLDGITHDGYQLLQRGRGGGRDQNAKPNRHARHAMHGERDSWPAPEQLGEAISGQHGVQRVQQLAGRRGLAAEPGAGLEGADMQLHP